MLKNSNIGCNWLFQIITRNATCCNNRDDLLHLSFTFTSKISIFSEPICNQVEHLWWSLYCENSKPLSIFTKKAPSYMLAWVLNTPLLFEDSSNVLFFKGNAQFIFLCNPQKSCASWVYIMFLQITQKILTKDIYYWLEVITEIQCEKNNHSAF